LVSFKFSFFSFGQTTAPLAHFVNSPFFRFVSRNGCLRWEERTGGSVLDAEDKKSEATVTEIATIVGKTLLEHSRPYVEKVKGHITVYSCRLWSRQHMKEESLKPAPSNITFDEARLRALVVWVVVLHYYFVVCWHTNFSSFACFYFSLGSPLLFLFHCFSLLPSVPKHLLHEVIIRSCMSQKRI
jgi:hypothetical protein